MHAYQNEVRPLEPKQNTQMHFSGPVTLTMTDHLDTKTWPGYYGDVPRAETDFVGQGYQKLEPEQNRHTDRCDWK